MRIVLFCHSLVSDWNHGNAHFLRGIVRVLKGGGHDVDVYEPADGWSLRNLLEEHGKEPLRDFATAFPGMSSTFYDLRTLDLDRALFRADLVLVHEWNGHDLVRSIGEHRALEGRYRLFFHDTHHRSVTEPVAMAAYDLRHYDGVLAFGNVIRDIYRREGWARQAWTWHEAADVPLFRPWPERPAGGDLVWVGNWGDDERTAELEEYLLRPVGRLKIAARVYGVRYPPNALEGLAREGIAYGGWLPNGRVPEVFAAHRVTVHVPRRPYVEALPGIPTIRPFEAMACGIPLVCSPWEDAERLFTPGEDYLVARDGEEMVRCIRTILTDRGAARRLALRGLRTVLARHTCAHRVRQLLHIHNALGSVPRRGGASRRRNAWLPA